MNRILILGCCVAGLAGCANVMDRLGPERAGRVASPAAAPAAPAKLAPATAAPPPPPAANTADALDTTTPEQRAAATQPSAGGGRSLGTTVVTLGSATEPGLWIKTPLVQAEAQGRVTNPATGQSSAVTLIPKAGEATAGSQMSLAALRLIGASLTDLTTVEVSLDG